MLTAAKERRACSLGRRLTAVVLGLSVLTACGLVQLRHDYTQLPPVPRAGELSLSAVVLDRNDRLLRAFTSADDKWRLPVDLAQIDPLYFRMLLAFEDRRFRDHGGVDARAILRAAWQSLRSGRIVSGGSTLTMQVARLLDEEPTRSFSRKYSQFLRAFQLESVLSKDEILRLYALRAPFGGNLEGVRAACLTWFGKEPGRLTPAEAALLVALPQSPEGRRPDRHPDRARAARDRVLATAAARHVISAGDAASAAAEPLRLRRHAMPFLAPHESRRAVAEAPDRPVHGLTIDRDLQQALEELARRKASGLPRPVSLAILVADHETGEILASVGAPDLLDETRSGHVDMTRAVRSPGSTLKPFIYGLAFEEGIGVPGSFIEDRATDIAGYQPTNFDRAYQGTVTLTEALQLSLNTPAVRLLEAVGPARLMARLKRAGAEPVLEAGAAPGLAIGLGGLGLSLKDLAQAYAALANGGAPVRLTVCRKDCGAAAPATTGPVLSARSSAQVTAILAGLPQVQSAETFQIAYKTGTAYGYRDAWAVGYDGRHVVAIWSGRADGTPVPGATGASVAVPILFEVFQALGPRRVSFEPGRLAHIDTGTEVPLALRYARLPEIGGATASAQDPVRIFYPPDGAELDLGLAPRAGAGQGGQGQPLVVKFKGGRAPFSYLVNDRPVVLDDSDRQLVWQPDAAGFAQVTILDSRGDSARITVRLR